MFLFTNNIIFSSFYIVIIFAIYKNFSFQIRSRDILNETHVWHQLNASFQPNSQQLHHHTAVFISSEWLKCLKKDVFICFGALGNFANVFGIID